MKKYKKAKQFIKTFKLKRIYTTKDLTDILKKQGFQFYEYSLFSEKTKQLFVRLDCFETATANCSFSISSDEANLCCVKNYLSEKEKAILLLHENLHIYMGDVKKDCPISPMQEKTVTDLHFIVDFILNARRYVRVLSAVFVTALFLGTVHHFTYPKSPVAYYYVTPKGTHYHKEDCDEILTNPNSFKISAEDARKSYLPCSKCKPDRK